MPEITFSIEDNLFPNKEINHIIRYCSKLKYIEDNIMLGGFHSSYCKEKFNNNDLLIPMVSFCNIPIRDVENYMYYGDYGLGFTMEWAIDNKLSPVIYVHENSDFLELSKNIDADMLTSYVSLFFKEFTDNILSPNENQHNFSKHFYDTTVLKFNQLNIRVKQFTKFWKSEVEFNVNFNDIDCNKNITKIINSYNEREWKYVPDFKNNEYHKFINKEDKTDDDFEHFSKSKKPHITDNNFTLRFELEDIKYIIVSKNEEVEDVIKILKNKYKDNEVNERLNNGKLNIISREALKKDF
jgi:hypothetical protein